MFELSCGHTDRQTDRQSENITLAEIISAVWCFGASSVRQSLGGWAGVSSGAAE